MRRYWVMRTDRNHPKLFWKELQAGRLRQGWSYLPEQDLRVIQKSLTEKKNVTEDQQNTWRGNRRMLDSEPDSIQQHDLIISPHLPEEGKWSISEVVGPYAYKIISKPSDPADSGPDYGHNLPVKLRTLRAIDPYEEAVAASLRQTMRNMSRLWNIDYLGPEVESLLLAVEGGAASVPLKSAKRLSQIQEGLDKAAWKEFSHHFQSGEFEEPCIQLLKKIFGDENVQNTAGRNERGADAICAYNDAFGSPHSIAVQIKMWDRQAGWTRPIEQVHQAYQSYEGITSAIIFSTSEDGTQEFEKARKELEKNLRIPVRVIYRKELLRLFMIHLPGLIAEI